MSVRPDNRLADAPMVDLRCRRCQVAVEVRKASWYQISIQWHDQDEAGRRCEERAAGGTISRRGGIWAGCDSLRASIREAVADGSLPMPD
jgi:hypothetical protein